MTLVNEDSEELAISPEEIQQRRNKSEPGNRVVFRVAGLYGFCKESLEFPISRTETIDSGPISATLDPEGDVPGSNIGIIDYGNCDLRIRYGGHLVFPGIHDLVMSGKHDLSLLGPVRVTATDDCVVTPDLTGWRALGTMDFLPGSIWAGASGG